MKEEKLFKRLIARFHSTKIAQKLTSLAVASTLALSISGCTEDLPETPNSNNETNINNSYDNTQNNNSNNNNNNQNNNLGGNVDASGYSEILQLVLNDPYYRSLTETLYEGSASLRIKSNKYAPIPYAFLEDEGFDVEEIINEELSTRSVSYVLDSAPNDLYMVFSVETHGETPYYTQYILKYTLTDKEMEDFRWVHSEECGQAPLMNQAIGELKTPEIISKNKITIEAYENLLEFSSNRTVVKNLLGGKKCINFAIKEIDEANGKFVAHMYPPLPDSSMIVNSVIADANWSQCFEMIEFNSDGAMFRPLGYNDFDIYSEDNQHQGQKATFFNPQDCNVRRSSMEDLLEQ